MSREGRVMRRLFVAGVVVCVLMVVCRGLYRAYQEGESVGVEPVPTLDTRVADAITHWRRVVAADRASQAGSNAPYITRADGAVFVHGIITFQRDGNLCRLTFHTPRGNELIVTVHATGCEDAIQAGVGPGVWETTP